ncbi:MAG TPA: TonB-dependent receptor [Acetobacteraceae bacterium]|nr:TonB-dependent receptor [Acetobacteraceae bacterium]
MWSDLHAQTVAPLQLEQVIVTAKKRRQNIQSVPQTVDVVGGATIKRLAITQFQDIQLLVSGLTLSDNGGQGQNISLRGITYDPDTAANPAVDLYFNEVPISQTSSVFQDLYDIESVEVVRGPQGTLRGRTSPAGAILINTKRPDLEKWDGSITQIFATDDQIQTQIATGGPIVPDKLAVRFAGLFDQNDLYGTRDISTGKSDYNRQHSYRLTIEAKPTDALDVVLTYQESNDRTRELFGVSGTGLEGTFTPADNIAVVPGPYTFYDRTGILTLEASYKLAENEFDYVGGYQALRDEFQEYQDKGGLYPKFNAGSQELANGLEQLTQEIRFQSSGERRFGYMVGAYYAHQDADADVFTPSEFLFEPSPGSPHGVAPVAIVNADVKIPQLVSDYAVFTDETFKLTPDDIFEGGVRWQFEKQYRNNTFVAIIPPIFGGGSITEDLIQPNNQKEEYHAWTGLASYTHRFSNNLSLYATYGESYRPGGAVVGESIPLPESFLLFRPEESYDFEIGGKTQLFNGRVRINADIFNQTYTNYIGRQPELFTNLGYATATTNGNAVARGAEFSANAIVTDAWRLQLNTTFDDSHYDNAKLPCNDFSGSGYPNTDGPPRVFPAGAISSTCTVNDSLGAPNWFVSVNSEYDIPINGNVESFFRALYTFTPRNHLGLQDVDQDPRNFANIYAGLRGGRWEVFAFIKNLFDTVGYTNIFGEQYDAGYRLPTITPENYDTGYASANILRPRQFGVSLSYKF